MEQYFLNQPSECVKLPGNEKYLLKENFLSEFFTENEKALACSNLGIASKLEELKALYNSTPIPSGSVRFGMQPTRGSYNEVLSSDVIYRALQEYLTKEQFENWLSTLDNLLDKKQDKEDSYTKEEFNTLLANFTSQLDERIEALSAAEQNLTDAVERMETLVKTNSKISIQFISHSNAETNIRVNITSQSVLRQIKVYINRLLVFTSEDLCYSTQIPFTITEDSDIKVITTNIFDVETTLEEHIVNSYFVPEGHIYIGGAYSFDELFANNSPQEFTNRYTVTLTRNSNLILMIPTSQVFVRADMNGIEIPFNQPESINNFKVYTSRNVYQSGTYTIDINS